MKRKNFIKKIKLSKPDLPEYTVILETDKDRERYVTRIEKIVRKSDEYRDYIKYLKDSMELDSCIFFNKVSSSKNKGNRGHISVEIHHDPLTLFDIVNAVVTKFEEEGTPLNDLLIADEVMMLHYENEVGLVPVSKTAHEMLHNSEKLFVPLNMVYGEYSRFLTEYDKYIDEAVYDKIEKKMILTKEMTPEKFDALTRELKLIDVDGFEDIEKLETSKDINNDDNLVA